MKNRRDFLLAATAGTLLATPAMAQFGDLAKIGSALGTVNKLTGNKIGLDKLTGNNDPITTSLKDAIYGDASKDGFVPKLPLQKLTSLARGANGSFILQAGYFEFHAQSYCFHAGTHGPGGGEGYLFAPTLGSAAQIITQIRQNSYSHPEIDQHTIQSLIWAILARAKFESLNDELKLAAMRLMTKQQLATLNRGALDYIPPEVLNQVISSAPPALRQALNAQATMRNMFNGGSYSFGELERIAVINGRAPWGEGSIQVPSGRWSKHPDGYWIKYVPSGYSHTKINIWVETGAICIGKPLDLCTHIAVPCNTSCQRLGQSNREYGV